MRHVAVWGASRSLRVPRRLGSAVQVGEANPARDVRGWLSSNLGPSQPLLAA